MNVNERARAAAAKAGRDTFLFELIDHWSACTDCGTPIRRNIDIGRIGLWRGCGCVGVAWSCGRVGWERHELPTPSQLQAEPDLGVAP